MKIDLVNLFCRSDQVETIVNEILDIGDAKCIWFQIGVINDTATRKAIDNRLLVAQGFFRTAHEQNPDNYFATFRLFASKFYAQRKKSG